MHHSEQSHFKTTVSILTIQSCSPERRGALKPPSLPTSFQKCVYNIRLAEDSWLIKVKRNWMDSFKENLYGGYI